MICFTEKDIYAPFFFNILGFQGLQKPLHRMRVKTPKENEKQLK